MAIMEGKLSKYFMYRALIGQLTSDVWVWVGGCPNGSVGVCVCEGACVSDNGGCLQRQMRVFDVPSWSSASS